MFSKKVILFITFFYSATTLFAQAPGGVPYGNPEPVDLDLFNIILLIVVPVLIFVIYFWYRRKKKK